MVVYDKTTFSKYIVAFLFIFIKMYLMDKLTIPLTLSRYLNTKKIQFKLHRLVWRHTETLLFSGIVSIFFVYSTKGLSDYLFLN